MTRAPATSTPGEIVVDRDAAARLPRAIAFRHDALPLRLRDGVLTVADALRAAARVPLRAVTRERDAIRASLHAVYPDAADEPRERDDAPAVRAVDARSEER